jgi:hypothetical protein
MASIIPNPSSPEKSLNALVETVNELQPEVNTLLEFQPAAKTVSASYTALPADGTIFYSGVMDGSHGITLPTTGIPAGKTITVKVVSTDATGSALNVNTSNAGEYAGNPQLFTIPAGAAAGGVATLQWDGAKWWLLEYSQ